MGARPPFRSRRHGRPLALLALLALVVLAGCHGLGGVETETPTVTPAPVPTASPTSTPVPTVAPGITADGTVAPAVVVDSHRTALADDSYTATVRRTVRVEGTVQQVTFARTWVANDSYRLVQYVNESRPGRVTTATEPAVDLWYNGTAAFYRITDSTGTPYVRARDVDRETLPDPTFGPLLADLLAAGRFRVVDTTNGTVRLAATDIENTRALAPVLGAERLHNVSLSVTVTPTGVVRSTRLAYDATSRDREARVVQRTRVSAVDATTVPVPTWAAGNGSSIRRRPG